MYEKEFDLEYERYKDFDMSGAKPVTNPKILAARARKDELEDLKLAKLAQQREHEETVRVTLDDLQHRIYSNGSKSV